MKKRQIVRMFVVLQVVILALLAVAAPALASSDRDVAALTKAKTGIMVVKPAAKAKSGEPYEIWYQTDKKVKNQKTSNKKVANIILYNWGEINNLVVIPLKAGKTKLSFTYNGKKYTTTYTVMDWKNPVKKFTIGKTNIASKFKQSSSFAYNSSKRTFFGKKVSVSPASGWKVVSIEANTGKALKKIKNGATIPKSAYSVVVTLQHTKTGAIAHLDVE